MRNEDYMSIDLPMWQEFGAQQHEQAPTTGTSPFVTMLKKRLNHPMMKQGGDHLAVGKIAPTDAGKGGGAPSSL